MTRPTVQWLIDQRTMQSSPAGREAPSSIADWFELRRKTDWRHSIIERELSLQLQQHYVIARVTWWSAVLGVRYHLNHSHSLSELVRFPDVVHSNHHCAALGQRQKSTTEPHNCSYPITRLISHTQAFSPPLGVDKPL